VSAAPDGLPVRSTLRLAGVSVRRGGARLLSGVDWDVGDGERWVVLGANGAGKTTLLQVAGGLLAPTTGRVELLGVDPAEAEPEELLARVGWTSASLADQLPRRERALDVVLTASYAALRRGGEPYADLDDARARELLAQVGCRALADRRYGSLSEGERKRVQIARALMTDPELLLLDEPAAGLDLGAREALLRRLTRLAGDPSAPTMVLVSHHLEEVPPGFTHALLLRAGAVLDAGPLAEVLTSRRISACFGFPVTVEGAQGRFSARALARA